MMRTRGRVSPLSRAMTRGLWCELYCRRGPIVEEANHFGVAGTAVLRCNYAAKRTIGRFSLH